MNAQDVCRHGLLTLDRNGVRIHAHDGSRCEPSSATPSTPPPPEPPTDATPVPSDVESVVAAGPLAYETVHASERTVPEATDGPGVAPMGARRSKPGLLVGGLLAVALLIAVGVVGGVIARNNMEREKERATAAERHVASLEEKLAGKDSTIEGQRSEIAGYEQQQDALRQREAELDQREQSLQAAEGANATSFGDGLYQVKVAIQPGQYHTEGTDSCYWAKLSTGDTNSIIENILVSGPQTVTIDSAYFESENCGTWTKIVSSVTADG